MVICYHARLYVAGGNGALSQATSTMGERFCQTRPQEEALEILKCNCCLAFRQGKQEQIVMDLGMR